MARNPLTPFRSGAHLGGDPFLSLHREMNRLFDDILRGSSMGSSQGMAGGMIAPHVNVSETDNEFRVTAELPGVTEDDIQVDVHDNMLMIRGEKKLEHKDEKENFHFIERSYGTFQRNLQLPFAVDPDQVKADFENGVLTVTIPKNAQQQRARRIQVQARGKSQGGGAGKSSTGERQETQGGKSG
jgi:HSP20 family protein